MIDHVLGRPSSKSRRLQVLAVLAFWSAYLARGNRNGPPGLQRLSRLASKTLTAWQVVLLTMLYLYGARNFSTLVGLASPDPLANMYEASFFRATWVLTALDAGFWTAMKIRRKWVRDLASVVFSVFYMVAAEQADEKVRKVRGHLTVEHLRVSWNKGTTPYLSLFQKLTRPRLTKWPPRQLRIARSENKSKSKNEYVTAWLYYDGPLDQLRASGIDRVVLDIPGGGFVAMDPRCNDDRLLSWAVQTGLPVVSLDYKKAPEYPFPYALNECHDAYATIVHTKGRCLGLAGDAPVRVVVTGDSAGGNLAAATTLLVAEHGRLPVPDGLVLVYPCLDVNIGNWMSDEQMALMQDRRVRATNRNVLRRKAKQYSDIAGTPHETDDELGMAPVPRTPEDAMHGDRAYSHVSLAQPAYSHVSLAQTPTTEKAFSFARDGTNKDNDGSDSSEKDDTPPPMSTRLATASSISYFNDRVLTPEMMRAMIILYVGPHNRPDFAQDYRLAPILAPDALLAQFPKTYFLTGERDPLVDDTVIFAGRLRRIKMAQHVSRGRRVAYRESDAARCGSFDERDVAEVVLIPGVSHGFMQVPAVYPAAWQWFKRTAAWIEDAFHVADEKRERTDADRGRQPVRSGPVGPVFQTAPSTPEKTEKKTNGLGLGVIVSPEAHKDPTPSATSATTTTTTTTTTDTGDVPVQARLKGTAAKRPRQPKRVESSGDEAPLEMMRMTKAKKASASASSSAASSTTSTSATTPDEKALAADTADPTDTADARRKTKVRRVKDDDSLVKLKSSDDLLGRRMHGIAGGLTGLAEE